MDNFMSRNKTIAMRGIAIISIILYHFKIFSVYNNLLILFPFGYMSYIGVALFFFLSGYGLMQQFERKENYLKGFIPKRLLRIWIPYLLFYIAYIVLDLIFVRDIDIIHALANPLTFSFGSNENNFTTLWYLFASAIFYVLFYIAFRIKASEKVRILVLFSLIAAYMIVCVLIGRSPTWYFNALWFPIGVLFSFKNEKIKPFIKRFKWVTATASLICIFGIYAFLYLFGFVINGVSILNYLHVFFIISVITLMISLSEIVKIKLQPIKTILYFFGNNSLELYIIHQFFASVIFGEYIDTPIKSVIYFAASIIIAPVLSFVSGKTIKFIFSKFRI